MNLQEQISRIREVMGVVNEGLHDTSWENEKGDKITLMDLLNATEEIPVQKISVEELKPYLLSWDDDPEEIKKIEKSDLQYPILIFVTSNGEFISIIDGHHRAQKAARKGLETIKAKIINIDCLPKNIRKVFSHLGNQEEMTEGEFDVRSGHMKLDEKTLLRLKTLAKPYDKKRQFLNAEPAAYFVAKKLGVLDELKDWKPRHPHPTNLPHLKSKTNEGEITERCWKGYTQKGMKTMFGKRYPNCVKKTK